MFAGFEQRMVDAGGVAINCRTGGAGRKAVLLLHGYPQTHAMSAPVVPVLAERCTVVCADLRGYGDSAKPDGRDDPDAYTFRAMAAEQLAVMNALGHERFHLVGHDRGARVGHRMALDHPDVLHSLTVPDIVPALVMWRQVSRLTAAAYWHWYFLSLDPPFPERLIGADPDFFFGTCFETWGATRLDSLHPALAAEYRRCWNDPSMIRASCADYRAPAQADLEHDEADAGRLIASPTLAMWGAQGRMAQMFDLRAVWAAHAKDRTCVELPGGHFFVDQHPAATAEHLVQFLDGVPGGRP